MMDLLARFFIGGIIVTLFAVLGDIFHPEVFRRPLRWSTLCRARHP